MAPIDLGVVVTIDELCADQGAISVHRGEEQHPELLEVEEEPAGG